MLLSLHQVLVACRVIGAAVVGAQILGLELLRLIGCGARSSMRHDRPHIWLGITQQEHILIGRMSVLGPLLALT